MPCQNCGRPLTIIHDFGNQPLCNDLSPDAKRFPLRLAVCDYCDLVQIADPLPPDVVFPTSYPYRSRMTGELMGNFDRLARAATAYCGLNADSLVFDIGSNDGSLLERFRCRVMGVEPTDAAKDARVATEQAYFTGGLAQCLRESIGQADLITACNVFAHIPDVHDVLDGIDALLKPDGTFICENHDFTQLLLRNQWDTIYHEHARYYSVDALERVLQPHGFHIRKVEQTLTHGGSFRAYIGREPSEDPTIAHAVLWSRAQGTSGLSQNVRLSTEMIAALVHEYTSVWGIGAPSRGGMLVSYSGIDLAAVCELPGSPKIGQYMPGTHIPIVDESELYRERPPAVLVLSWHIGERIASKLREKGYRGRIFAPLPVPTEL